MQYMPWKMNSDLDSANYDLMIKVKNMDNIIDSKINMDDQKDDEVNKNICKNNCLKNEPEKSVSTSSESFQLPKKKELQVISALNESHSSQAEPEDLTDKTVDAHSVDIRAEKIQDNVEKNTIGVNKVSTSDKQNGKRRRSRSCQGNQYNKKNSTKMEITINSDLIQKVTEEAVLNIQENPSFLTKSDHYVHFYDFINYAKVNTDLFPVNTTKEGTHTVIKVSKAKKGKCVCPKDLGRKKVCGKITIYKCLECSLEQSEPKFFCVNHNNFYDENSCFNKHKKLTQDELKKRKFKN